MTTSGSFDYSVQRDDIINAALRYIGRLDPNVTPSSEDTDQCAEILNERIKSLNNTVLGRQLFVVQQGFLFFEQNKTAYLLGPGGDHATRSYTQVAAQSTVASTKVVLPNGAWAASQYIGMNNTDGGIQWETISSVSNSTTVVLSNALSATVTTSANIFVYTDKIERPIEVLHAALQYTEGWDEEISYMSKETYRNIYDKDQSGDPTRYHYEPLLTNGKFYINYQPTDFRDIVKFDYRRPFEDFDAATNNPDLPQELIRLIKWLLASDIGVIYGIPERRQNMIDQKAAQAMGEIRSLYGTYARTSEPGFGRHA